MTIKVLELTEGCMPEIIEQGDWIDLKLAQDVVLKAPYSARKYVRKGSEKEYQHNIVFDSTIASLGVCIQVPKGYECIVVPRSSTFKKYGILQSNSMGVIDQSYCGDQDFWRMPMVATRAVTIPKGTRIAQFRIQLSQGATCWQKIKWLFSHKPKFVKVESLSSQSRGGFGSTGNN